MDEIKRLQSLYESIPARGAINLARRRAIQQQILRLMEQLHG